MEKNKIETTIRETNSALVTISKKEFILSGINHNHNIYATSPAKIDIQS